MEEKGVGSRVQFTKNFKNGLETFTYSLLEIL